jgi:hypothetical protein
MPWADLERPILVFDEVRECKRIDRSVMETPYKYRLQIPRSMESARLRLVQSIVQTRRMMECTLKYVGYEALTAVVMNVAIFWDIAPSSPFVHRRFRGTLSPPSSVSKISRARNQHSILKMEVIHSSETLVHILTTRAISQKMATYRQPISILKILNYPFTIAFPSRPMLYDVCRWNSIKRKQAFS